jgi:hypothetical protein
MGFLGIWRLRFMGIWAVEDERCWFTDSQLTTSTFEQIGNWGVMTALNNCSPLRYFPSSLAIRY